MRIVSLMLMTLITGVSLDAQDNPFIGMTTRTYAGYCRELEQKAYSDWGKRDAEWAAQVAAQMREAAAVSKNAKWTLEADFFELMFGFDDNLHAYKADTAALESQVKRYTAGLKQIIRRAQRLKAVDIELRAKYGLWRVYRYEVRQYVQAFRYGQELDRALSAVATAQFPLRPFYYSETGQLYFDFEEYETARTFLEKGMENLVYSDEMQDIRRLWHNLGLFYRNYYMDYGKSDSCFLLVVEAKPENPHAPSPTADEVTNFTNQDEYELWEAIAKGNIGSNRYATGDDDEAIPLLLFSVERVARNNPYNYLYAAQKALTLSYIYFDKSDFERTRLYAEMAYGFGEKDRIWNNESEVNTQLLVEYYPIMNRYWRLLGDAEQALLYADSAAAARARFDDEYNLRQLFDAEQHARLQELQAEMQRSKTYRRNLTVTAACATLFLALLLVIFFLYRQKEAAYRELVVKTQDWVRETCVQPVTSREDSDETPTPADRQIFDSLSRLMAAQQTYLDPDVSLDTVALQLKINRTYISQAVNRCTGDNFAAFINEFRVKEAVRLLSDLEKNNLSIEGIAMDAGFGNRITLNRVFKKTTGLSPTTFRRKAQE